MGFNSVPPRWDFYTKMGSIIPGTQIIPFKCPLRKEICKNLSDSNLSFTVNDLVNTSEGKRLSMVIDLTLTKRFYNGIDLEKFGIKHMKMSTQGGGCMPTEREVNKFCDVIDNQLKQNPDTIIGVHCTHGLNRTGFFICRYMIDRLGITGSESVNLFEESRGHKFDRENYRSHLMARVPQPQNYAVDIPISPTNNSSPMYRPEKQNHFSETSCDNSNRKRRASEEYSSFRDDRSTHQFSSYKDYKRYRTENVRSNRYNDKSTDTYRYNDRERTNRSSNRSYYQYDNERY